MAGINFIEDGEFTPPLKFRNEIINHQKNTIMEATKTVFLTKEQFEMDLEICLTIISYPTKTRKYYVCEYINPALYKSVVQIELIN